jgi:hypothetical protein
MLTNELSGGISFYFLSPGGLAIEAAAPATGKFGPKKSWRGTNPQPAV